MQNNIIMQLSNQFLIAMPSLNDSNFTHTVTYLCDHSEDGTMGLTINRPLDITLGEVFDQMDLTLPSKALADTIIFSGGPVQIERGFILHPSNSDWDATLKVSDSLSVTSSRDILQAIADDKGPEKFFFSLGYSGWSAGQLEKEIAQNSWLHGPADESIIFSTQINRRWQLAAELIGIDVNLISTESGHA